MAALARTARPCCRGRSAAPRTRPTTSPCSSRLDGGEAYIAASAGVPGAASAGRYPAGARDLADLLAAGRVLLAWQPPDRAAESLERIRALSRERRELFDEVAIREGLERIREQRFATLVGDAHGCVAAPVFGRDGDCFAAVAIVVGSRRMRRDLERLATLGRAAASAVSSALAEEAGAKEA